MSRILRLAIAAWLAAWTSGCSPAGTLSGGSPAPSDGGTSSGSTTSGGTSSGSTTSGGTSSGGTTSGGTSSGATSSGGASSGGTSSGATSSGGASSGGTPPGAGYALDPPDPCLNQFWVQGCRSGDASSACGGRCAVANACSPPESSDKASLPKTFVCPRFMLFSDELKQAARDDAAAYGWGDASDPPFAYGVVGHDVDTGGLDAGSSTCCQCYQLVLEKPEPGSPQPPELAIPKPLIVQSFNTAAGGGKNFDLFMGAGGFGAFNACVAGSYPGTQTTTFGAFMYEGFPSDYNGQGGIKFLNLDACKANGTTTLATLGSSACQGRVAELCDAAASASAATERTTRASCKESNLPASAYHQNWTVRARKVECPAALTRVTGCRLAPSGLPQPDPTARTVATAGASFRAGYTTTTMQDCCKPTCAWRDFTTGAGLTAAGPWTSFYSCDQAGVPLTAPAP